MTDHETFIRVITTLARPAQGAPTVAMYSTNSLQTLVSQQTLYRRIIFLSLTWSKLSRMLASSSALNPPDILLRSQQAQVCKPNLGDEAMDSTWNPSSIDLNPCFIDPALYFRYSILDRCACAHNHIIGVTACACTCSLYILGKDLQIEDYKYVKRLACLQTSPVSSDSRKGRLQASSPCRR